MPNLRTFAGMATTGNRDSVVKAVFSLSKQVDVLNIYWNNGKLPEKNQFPDNVQHFFDEKLGDIGDLGKFLVLQGCDGINLTVDDDIIYPDDYVSTLSRQLTKYSVLGVHGIKFNFPIQNYYTQNRFVLHFESSLGENTEVDVLGTGTTCFFHELIKNLDIKNFLQYKNMADIFFVTNIKKKNIKFFTVKRKSFWLKQIPIYESIYKSSIKNENNSLNTGYLQTGYVREFFRNKSLSTKYIPINFDSTQHIHYYNNFINKKKHGIMY